MAIETTPEYQRTQLMRDLTLATSDLGFGRAKFCMHRGQWLLLTRGGREPEQFVVARSPRTGLDGLCVLAEAVESFNTAQLWTFQATVCVRSPQPLETREEAEARWQDQLAEIQSFAVELPIEGERFKKTRKRRGALKTPER